MNLFSDIKFNLKEIMERQKLLQKINPICHACVTLEKEIKMLQEDYRSSIIDCFDEDLLEDVEGSCRKKNIGLYSEEFLKELQQQYEEKRLSRPRIFFDMDGVLFKSQDKVSSLEIFYEQGYFKNLSIHKNVMESFNRLLEKDPHQVYIISHLVDSPFARKEKLESIVENCPLMDKHNIIFLPYGESKSRFVPEDVREKDILIDDYNPNLYDWQNQGGVSIKMVNEFNDRSREWDGMRLQFDDPKLYEYLVQLKEGMPLMNTANKTMEQQMEMQKNSVMEWTK